MRVLCVGIYSTVLFYKYKIRNKNHLVTGLAENMCDFLWQQGKRRECHACQFEFQQRVWMVLSGFENEEVATITSGLARTVRVPVTRTGSIGALNTGQVEEIH